MKLFKNQTVKWKQIGGEVYREGTYLGKHADRLKVRNLSGTILQLPGENVSPLTKITDEELEKYAADNIDALENTIREGAVALLPKFKSSDICREKGDLPELRLLYGTITVEAAAIEVRSIGGFREIPGWSVTIWHHRQATYHEPPDVTDESAGTARNVAAAATLAVNTMFRCMASDYWQAKAEEAMAAAWEAGEKDNA